MSSTLSHPSRDGESQEADIARTATRMPTSHTSMHFVLVFVVLATGIVLAGFLYYRQYQRAYRDKVAHQLSAVAELKESELTQWRKERIIDGVVLSQNAVFSRLVRQALPLPRNAEAWEPVRTWLYQVRTAYQYAHISIYDAQGVERLAIPEASGLDPSGLSPHAMEVMQSNQVAIEDFRRDARDGRIYLSVLAPIPDEPDGGRAIGLLVLRIDPELYLYPFIKRWPTRSETAESLLVRREGNEAVFLNELRFQTNTALNRRVPLDQVQMPAVMAALGREGIVEGRDYRGVPVVAEVRPIPESPWCMVTRMDLEEVDAPLRTRLWSVVTLVGALLLGAGTSVGWVWRQQRVRFYREQVRAASALRESDIKFRTLFESMTEGVALHEVVLDAAGQAVDYRVLDVNPAYTRHTGLAVAHVRGRLASALYGPGAPPYLEEYARVARTGQPHAFEVFFAPLARHFSISAVSPKPGQFATVFEDITERKIREEELHQKNAELERVTYTISHDLRSPVVTIKTFLGYLEQDMANNQADRVAKDMHFMHVATSKIGRLLDELLELMRIGRFVQPPVRVTHQALVAEALAAVAGRLAERGVDVQIEKADIPLIGDRARLVAIWQNLVDNAVKYMGDQAAPRVDIGFEPQGRNTVFFVRDNGMGIEARFQTKIFNLFEKLDPASEGTGLGLALVKRIVELYHGTIKVESEGIGKGSCFRFTLPDAVTVISDPQAVVTEH